MTVNKFQGSDPYDKFRQNLPESAEKSEGLENQEIAGEQKKGKLKGAFDRAREITGMAGNTLLRESLKMGKEERKSDPVIKEESSSSEESLSEESVSDGRERIDFRDGDNSGIVSYRKTHPFNLSRLESSSVNSILEHTYILPTPDRHHHYSYMFGSDIETH